MKHSVANAPFKLQGLAPDEILILPFTVVVFDFGFC